ncbi:hypothetical protein FB451DRAFT_1173442 [Mycena latifolia]|nr:hypothetical protein FB451DRAFT_1173442 [Mycena latifolia]
MYTAIAILASLSGALADPSREPSANGVPSIDDQDNLYSFKYKNGTANTMFVAKPTAEIGHPHSCDTTPNSTDENTAWQFHVIAHDSFQAAAVFLSRGPTKSSALHRCVCQATSSASVSPVSVAARFTAAQAHLDVPLANVNAAPGQPWCPPCPSCAPRRPGITDTTGIHVVLCGFISPCTIDSAFSATKKRDVKPTPRPSLLGRRGYQDQLMRINGP